MPRPGKEHTPKFKNLYAGPRNDERVMIAAEHYGVDMKEKSWHELGKAK